MSEGRLTVRDLRSFIEGKADDDDIPLVIGSREGLHFPHRIDIAPIRVGGLEPSENLYPDVPPLDDEQPPDVMMLLIE
jgi:hypothetical protein